MIDDIDKATEALIAAIRAEVERLPPWGKGRVAAKERLLTLCGRVGARMGQQTIPLRDEVSPQAKRKAEQLTAKRNAEFFAHRERMKKEREEELARLKADLFRTHPDHGGSEKAARAAIKRYKAFVKMHKRPNTSWDDVLSAFQTRHSR